MVELIGRRWNAAFEGEHLVLRRRRFLLWWKPDTRRIPLPAVVDIRPLPAADHARRYARITIADPASPRVGAILLIWFAPDQWVHADAFIRARRPATTRPARPATPPGAPAALRTTVPAQSRRQAYPVPSRIKAGDGKRPMWLWLDDGMIHASLVPTGDVTPRQLSAAEVAQLLLVDPARALPAIRSLTGIDDIEQALLKLREWLARDPVVVTLSAADLAGRRVNEAPPKRVRSNPDGTVRTVSGGLPSLNKRRR
ncbi:hypothetical protein ACWIGG_23650 [Micromonospora aurantiaca (nom. illeg.)]|uniref:hypothetical protein n=1 Tax=Micromonospora aurantiaca (nom. illeg.) TaxID=47850 RepID=UPI00365BEFE3